MRNILQEFAGYEPKFLSTLVCSGKSEEEATRRVFDTGHDSKCVTKLLLSMIARIRKRTNKGVYG